MTAYPATAQRAAHTACATARSDCRGKREATIVPTAAAPQPKATCRAKGALARRAARRTSRIQSRSINEPPQLPTIWSITSSVMRWSSTTWIFPESAGAGSSDDQQTKGGPGAGGPPQLNSGDDPLRGAVGCVGRRGQSLPAQLAPRLREQQAA